MRISDWSSDVCSSDLDRRWMIAAPVALLLAGAVGVNSFAHISKTAGACPIRHPAFCSSRALQAPVTRDLGHDGRSEEHTSELQSLMRISYAVFCLKKKKESYKINTKDSISKRYSQSTNTIIRKR